MIPAENDRPTLHHIIKMASNTSSASSNFPIRQTRDILLCTSQNVLLHGIGSKYELLQKIIASFSKSIKTVSIDGFNPNPEIPTGSDDWQIMIVHNIELLSASCIQTILTLLGSSKKIIASVDNVHVLQFNSLDSFGFNEIVAHTYKPYWRELSSSPGSTYEKLYSTRASSGITIASVQHVLSCVTSNMRQVFNLIVQHNHLKFSKLFTLARKEFLVNDHNALRRMLTEFFDHRIIQEDDNNFISVNLTDDQLCSLY